MHASVSLQLLFHSLIILDSKSYEEDGLIFGLCYVS